MKSPEDLAQEKKAIEDILPDLPKDEDDHLDLTLEEEGIFLQEYKTLLESLGL